MAKILKTGEWAGWIPTSRQDGALRRYYMIRQPIGNPPQPMAPRTRAAKARAAAAAEATCHLLDLSHDEQSIVTHELCDPLRPLLAVHLSSTAKGLWVPMQEQLAELKQRHAEASLPSSPRSPNGRCPRSRPSSSKTHSMTRGSARPPCCLLFAGCLRSTSSASPTPTLRCVPRVGSTRVTQTQGALGPYSSCCE